MEVDGVVHCSNDLYEGAALRAWKEWYSDRPVISITPTEASSQSTRPENPATQTDVDIAVVKFLDDALRKRGGNSVVYVRCYSVVSDS